jgi:hypothetical protein
MRIHTHCYSPCLACIDCRLYGPDFPLGFNFVINPNGRMRYGSHLRDALSNPVGILVAKEEKEKERRRERDRERARSSKCKQVGSERAPPAAAGRRKGGKCDGRGRNQSEDEEEEGEEGQEGEEKERGPCFQWDQEARALLQAALTRSRGGDYSK